MPITTTNSNLTESSRANSFSTGGSNSGGATSPTGSDGSRNNKNINTNIKTTATTMTAAHRHPLWAIGQAIFFFGSLLYYLFPGRSLYKFSLLGLASTYLMDVIQSCSSSPANMGWSDCLILSEKTPYLLICLVLYLCSPCAAVLLPLMLYSLLNLVGYCRSDPRVYELALWRQHLARPAEQLLAYHSHIMNAAVHLELFVLPWLIVSIFSLGPVLPLAYISFLRWQYIVSARTRQAVAMWDVQFTQWVEHPSCPKGVRRFYSSLQSSLKRWGRINTPVVVPKAGATNIPKRQL